MLQVTSSKYKSFLVWLLASMFYSLQMTLRILPAITMDYFTTKLGMNADDYGFMAGIYYLSYAIFQIPIGILMDKYQPKYIIVICMLVCAVGVFITIHAENKNHIYLARCLIGIGSTGGILGAIKTIDDFFPNQYSLFLGLTILCGVIGSVYGGVPIGNSFSYFGFEETLLFLIYISFGLSLAILFLYKKPNYRNNAISISKFLYVLKLALMNKELWWLGILGGLMVGPIGGFADMWGNKYLLQTKGLSANEASYATSLIFLGLGIGSCIAGLIIQKIQSLCLLIINMGLLQLIIMITLFSLESDDKYIIYPLALSIGLLSSYQIAVFSLANKLSSNQMVGAVSSLINSLIMFFCFVFNYTIGLILKKFFVSLSDEKIIYDKAAFHTSFCIIIFCLIAGIVGFLIIRKKKKL